MATSQETLIKNGVKIIQISASYDRKVSDGQYGSMGGFFSMTADVEPIVSVEDQMDMLFTFVRDSAAKHLRPEFAKTKTEIAAKIEEAINPEVPTTVSPSLAPPVTQPQAVTTPGADLHTLNIVKMTATPRADGKIDIRFFEAGHQYPDIYTTKTPVDACALLKATGNWTPAHFATAREDAIGIVITYKNSVKMNTKGNPYKDIVSVKPATA